MRGHHLIPIFGFCAQPFQLGVLVKQLLVVLFFEDLAVKISQQVNGVPASAARQRHIQVEEIECACQWRSYVDYDIRYSLTLRTVIREGIRRSKGKLQSFNGALEGFALLCVDLDLVTCRDRFNRFNPFFQPL